MRKLFVPHESGAPVKNFPMSFDNGSARPNGKRMDGLQYGDLNRVAHVCVDVQRMFAEKTEWHTPWLERVVPQIVAIASRHPAETIFTRFIPVHSVVEARGAWRRYYRRW